METAGSQGTDVILAVFFGKAVKMAAGIPHTHAAKSDLNLRFLADLVHGLSSAQSELLLLALVHLREIRPSVFPSLTDTELVPITRERVDRMLSSSDPVLGVLLRVLLDRLRIMHEALDDRDLFLDGIVVVPGLAFDRECRRLGQGRGYYDRYLAAMAGRAAALPTIAHATQAPAPRAARHLSPTRRSYGWHHKQPFWPPS